MTNQLPPKQLSHAGRATGRYRCGRREMLRRVGGSFQVRESPGLVQTAWMALVRPRSIGKDVMTSESNLGSDPIFGRFVEIVEKVRQIIDDTELELDGLSCDLKVLGEGAPIRSPGDQATAAAAQETARTLARTEELMAAEAARGAAHIDILPLPDGWARVSIDGRTAKLPPMLASLFAVLIADVPPGDDEFIAWKGEQQVRKMLSKISGNPVSGHSLTNLVSRLRRALRQQANLHRNFVQRHPQRGLRFALRRQGFESGEGVNPSQNCRDF